MEEVPGDWIEGKEKDPLSCSLALLLYKFGLSDMGWYGLSDAMITFIFRQYRKQGIGPDRRRVG